MNSTEDRLTDALGRRRPGHPGRDAPPALCPAAPPAGGLGHLRSRRRWASSSSSASRSRLGTRLTGSRSSGGPSGSPAPVPAYYVVEGLQGGPPVVRSTATGKIIAIVSRSPRRPMSTWTTSSPAARGGCSSSRPPRPAPRGSPIPVPADQAGQVTSFGCGARRRARQPQLDSRTPWPPRPTGLGSPSPSLTPMRPPGCASAGQPAPVPARIRITSTSSIRETVVRGAYGGAGQIPRSAWPACPGPPAAVSWSILASPAATTAEQRGLPPGRPDRRGPRAQPGPGRRPPGQRPGPAPPVRALPLHRAGRDQPGRHGDYRGRADRPEVERAPDC